MSDSATITREQLRIVLIGHRGKLTVRFQWKRLALSCASMLMLGLSTNIACAQTSRHGAKNHDPSALNEHSSNVQLGLRPSFEKCIDASGGVTSDMIDCDGEEYVFQDKRLNRVYKLLMSQLDAQEKFQLRDEERVWIKYRDTHCVFHDTGGTADDIAAHDCQMTQAALRAAQLQQRIHSGK